jgi:NADH-quinone oxidoreductase subunit G
MMAKMVNLTIDGQAVSVPEGTLVVNAAKQIGIDIPVFCYHPKMEPVGMCRMCLVEIGRPVIDRATGQPVREMDGSPRLQFMPKLETACTNPVSEGMVVLGMTDKVKAGREDVVEFLLTSHPLDCPVCDKGGECPLQNLTMGFGPGESRFQIEEKKHLAKHVPLGDLIYLDRERCIQCGRCVRFQDEIADDPVIGFYERGRSLQITTFSEPGFDSYFSGNTSDICPVGALTTADFRFKARPWELKAAASICNQCPVGCNITFNVRREAVSGGDWVIKRAMPRQNEAVNEIWMCDKGRFAYHYAKKNRDRLTQPLIRKNGDLVPAEWEEALELAALKLRSAGPDGLALVSGRLSNEDLFNLSKLAEGVKAKTALYTYMAGGDLTAQVGLGRGTNFADMGKGSAILVIASDLEEEAPIWQLRVKAAAKRGAHVIVANPRPTKLDRTAGTIIRYNYGVEAGVVQAMLNQLSAKRPNLPASVVELARTRPVQEAAQIFAEAENGVVIFGSEGLGLEGSQALAQACANLLTLTNHTGRANNGLLGVWPRANEQGAWDLGFRPSADLKADLASTRTLLAAGVDPFGDDPILAQAFNGFLIVQELYLTETARRADVVFPVQSFTEREGTYTSGERRVQRFYPAVPEPHGVRSDYAVAAMLGKRLGLDLEEKIASKVFLRLAASLKDYAGLSYQKLSEAPAQWPIVGRGDLYYGGTTYENTQGLGVQLQPAVERGEFPSLAWVDAPEWKFFKFGLVAVPATILYDRGNTILHSDLLGAHIPEPYVALNSDQANRRKIPNGAMVKLTLNETISYLVTARHDESLPEGIVLIPRSLGIPLDGPAAADIKVAEKAVA